MQRGGTVYMVTNQHHTVLYIGVTSDLRNRIWEHKTKKYSNSFTAKYNCDKLVWYESFAFIEEAIAAEKRLKYRSRKYKEQLISNINPEWKDMWEEIKNW